MSKKKQKRQASRPTRETPSVVTRDNPVLPRKGIGVVEFNPDYSHQLGDLKRIGVLAGSFFVILVVLSFFLR